jgi:hypothetical protein
MSDEEVRPWWCDDCQSHHTTAVCPKPTVRDIATVTVTAPVNGEKKRKARSDKGKKRTPKAVPTTLSLDDCLPDVQAAARQVRKPGQVFRVISAEEVWVMNG